MGSLEANNAGGVFGLDWTSGEFGNETASLIFGQTAVQAKEREHESLDTREDGRVTTTVRFIDETPEDDGYYHLNVTRYTVRDESSGSVLSTFSDFQLRDVLFDTGGSDIVFPPDMYDAISTAFANGAKKVAWIIEAEGAEWGSSVEFPPVVITSALWKEGAFGDTGPEGVYNVFSKGTDPGLIGLSFMRWFALWSVDFNNHTMAFTRRPEPNPGPLLCAGENMTECREKMDSGANESVDDDTSGVNDDGGGGEQEVAISSAHATSLESKVELLDKPWSLKPDINSTVESPPIDNPE